MTERRRLIVNADDLGYDPAVTRGILRAMKEGVVTSATFMVNTPYSAEAATQAAHSSLGLHLNLARWAPLSSAIPKSLLAGGEFVEGAVEELTAEMVLAETEAQLAELKRLLRRAATHIDVHKHLHRHSAVLEGVGRAAVRAHLPVRALDADMRQRLKRWSVPTTDHFVGEAGKEAFRPPNQSGLSGTQTQAYWTLERWRDALADLEPGVTELMCHPGYSPTHVKSGYGAQREIELTTFLAPEAFDALKEAGVERGDFRMLATP